MPLAVIALYFRQSFDETPVFKENKHNEKEFQNLFSVVTKQWRIILRVILLAGGFGGSYQISIIFMKQYLPVVLPQAAFIISSFSVLIVLCFAIAMPISGLIADLFKPIAVFKFSLFGVVCASMLLMIAIIYKMINLALGSCLILASFVAPFNLSLIHI